MVWSSFAAAGFAGVSTLARVYVGLSMAYFERGGMVTPAVLSAPPIAVGLALRRSRGTAPSGTGRVGRLAFLLEVGVDRVERRHRWIAAGLEVVGSFGVVAVAILVLHLIPFVRVVWVGPVSKWSASSRRA